MVVVPLTVDLQIEKHSPVLTVLPYKKGSKNIEKLVFLSKIKLKADNEIKDLYFDDYEVENTGLAILDPSLSSTNCVVVASLKDYYVIKSIGPLVLSDLERVGVIVYAEARGVQRFFILDDHTFSLNFKLYEEPINVFREKREISKKFRFKIIDYRKDEREVRGF